MKSRTCVYGIQAVCEDVRACVRACQELLSTVHITQLLLSTFTCPKPSRVILDILCYI